MSDDFIKAIRLKYPSLRQTPGWSTIDKQKNIFSKFHFGDTSHYDTRYLIDQAYISGISISSLPSSSINTDTISISDEAFTGIAIVIVVAFISNTIIVCY